MGVGETQKAFHANIKSEIKSKPTKSNTMNHKTPALKSQCCRIAFFLLLTALSMQQLSAQQPGQRKVYLVPDGSGYDTCETAEQAGRKWFDLNRKTAQGDESQNTYISSKESESGLSVVVSFQHTWINRAGIGGALKPKREKDPVATESTDILTESVEGNVKASTTASANRGTGTTLEHPNPAKKSSIYENHAEGSFSDISTKKKTVPTLKYDNPNPNGRDYIKFDGTDGPMSFVDRKLNVTRFPKSLTQVTRAGEALKQNPGATLRYEVPVNKVNDMKTLLKKAGLENNPRITVVGVDFQPYTAP